MATIHDQFTALRVIAKADGALQNLDREKVIDRPISIITSLEAGTSGGSPAVGVWIDLPDGRTVFGQTTLKLFLNAARVLAAAHGEPL